MKRQNLFKGQRGAASIVEYTIVLPLCLVVVAFLLLVAYFLNERAVLDAAAHRSVLVAEKMYFDSKSGSVLDLQYEGMTEDFVGYKKQANAFSDSEKGLDVTPYRFFLEAGEYKENAVKTMEQKAISCVMNNQLFPMGDRYQNLKVEAKIDGLAFKKATVVITDTYYMPKFVSLIGLDREYEMEVAAMTSLSAEPELIRNIDLVQEIMEDFQLDKYTDKIKEIFSKIGNFVSSLDGKSGDGGTE